jgi:hypothetical protein
MLNLPHQSVQITSFPHIGLYKLIKDVPDEIGATVRRCCQEEFEPDKAACIETKGFK